MPSTPSPPTIGTRHFLTLPLELRQAVYQYLFPVTHLYVRGDDATTSKHHRNRLERPIGGPALQLTCKQICEETHAANRQTRRQIAFKGDDWVYINTNEPVLTVDLQSVRVVQYDDAESPCIDPCRLPAVEELHVLLERTPQHTRRVAGFLSLEEYVHITPCTGNTAYNEILAVFRSGHRKITFKVYIWRV